MAAFALIDEGRVAGFIEAADGADLAARFHADVVAACIALTPEQAAEVVEGWSYADGAFSAPAAPPEPTSWYVPVPLLRQRLQDAGKWAAAAAALATDPASMLYLLTLQEGVANDDAQAIALLTGVGADPAAILARP